MTLEQFNLLTDEQIIKLLNCVPDMTAVYSHNNGPALRLFHFLKVSRTPQHVARGWTIRCREDLLNEECLVVELSFDSYFEPQADRYHEFLCSLGLTKQNDNRYDLVVNRPVEQRDLINMALRVLFEFHADCLENLSQDQLHE